MDTKEILKQVRHIEIRTRGVVNQILSGEYHSVFKGRGMEFSEVREYQFGDDIRTIDWNVSARFNHPFVKVFEEERELTVMLLVDFSGSKSFGTVQKLKNEVAMELCAVLAFSAMKNNDKVGMILFSDQIEKFIPPKKSRSHILRIIRELLAFTPQHKGTSLKSALEFFHHVTKKRSIAFLVSDFIDSGYEKPLRIVAQKHDLIAVQLFDPRETQLPNVGMMKMIDAETGVERWIDTSHALLRDTYAKEWMMNRWERSKTFLTTGVDSIDIDISKSIIQPLVDFFRMRERRY